jgi:hypothetical protein
MISNLSLLLASTTRGTTLGLQDSDSSSPDFGNQILELVPPYEIVDHRFPVIRCEIPRSLDGV